MEKQDLLLDWTLLKWQIHSAATKIRHFSEGDIWCTAIGENVGVEINGKSKLFSRPVLVFKKLSRLGFLGIPMTTQEHAGVWYVRIRFRERIIRAALSQIRVFSVQRLYNRMGQIDETDMQKIKTRLANLYLA